MPRILLYLHNYTNNPRDASTALCGSGPAFFLLLLEAAIDGGVAMGLPRAEARLMAAQTMAGAAGMVLDGEHPALLRERVTTPGGCTIGGLMVLEDGGARGTVARAVRVRTFMFNGFLVLVSGSFSLILNRRRRLWRVNSEQASRTSMVRVIETTSYRRTWKSTTGADIGTEFWLQHTERLGSKYLVVDELSTNRIQYMRSSTRQIDPTT